EIKTSYNAALGGPGDFSFHGMGGESALKFKNQARKYAQALHEKKIDGVTYQITARSVAPEVVEFLKHHLPNLKIIRYDSVLDTTGTVVHEQARLVQMQPKTDPKEFMKSHADDVVFITNGEVKAFAFKHSPGGDAHSTETVTALLTEAYEAAGWRFSETPPSSQAARFRFLIE